MKKIEKRSYGDAGVAAGDIVVDAPRIEDAECDEMPADVDADVNADADANAATRGVTQSTTIIVTDLDPELHHGLSEAIGNIDKYVQL